MTLTSILTGQYEGELLIETQGQEARGIPDGWSATRKLLPSRVDLGHIANALVDP